MSNDLPPVTALLAAHHGVPELAGQRVMLPAMTRAEWERMAGRMTPIHPPGGQEHAVVARALHGQPFGFTSEDAQAIAEYRLALEVLDDVPYTRGLKERASSLAAKIAALLPPSP